MSEPTMTARPTPEAEKDTNTLCQSFDSDAAFLSCSHATEETDRASLRDSDGDLVPPEKESTGMNHHEPSCDTLSLCSTEDLSVDYHSASFDETGRSTEFKNVTGNHGNPAISGSDVFFRDDSYPSKSVSQYSSEAVNGKARRENNSCDDLGEFRRSGDRIRRALDEEKGNLRVRDANDCGKSSDADRGVDHSFADIFSDSESAVPSEAQSEASMMVLLRYMGLASKPYNSPKSISRPPEKSIKETDDATALSDTPSEASMMVLMRYMRCTSKPYMPGPKPKGSMKRESAEIDIPFKHDLQEGDHVIRWKMLGYCYPIQVHGIVFSAGPDFVTIVDCGLASNNCVDKVGVDEQERHNAQKTKRRMNVLTLDDEKEIKKWTKISYGEQVELKVHSTNEEMQRHINERALGGHGKLIPTEIEESPSAGLELEEVEQCVQAKIKPSPEKPAKKSPGKSWFSWSCSAGKDDDVVKSNSVEQEKPKKKSQKLWLPKADPPALVLARLRFLLEHGEEPFPLGREDENDCNKGKKSWPSLLPPHHLLYANSECIAVYCKTGSWSTLQASIFLQSSTVGNAKQTATFAMFLSAQTVTVPASGLWGFFGGTTTVSLFAAQPWLVPALVGGGMVYTGLPMIMLWKAKGRWGDTEKRLNDAFWSMYDVNVIVEMIRCWSGLEG